MKLPPVTPPVPKPQPGDDWSRTQPPVRVRRVPLSDDIRMIKIAKRAKQGSEKPKP